MNPYITDKDLKLSKRSKRCCFTPYKSFENVLRMKKILLERKDRKSE